MAKETERQALRRLEREAKEQEIENENEENAVVERKKSTKKRLNRKSRSDVNNDDVASSEEDEPKTVPTKRKKQRTTKKKKCAIESEDSESDDIGEAEVSDDSDPKIEKKERKANSKKTAKRVYKLPAYGNWTEANIPAPASESPRRKSRTAAASKLRTIRVRPIVTGVPWSSGNLEGEGTSLTASEIESLTAQHQSRNANKSEAQHSLEEDSANEKDDADGVFDVDSSSSSDSDVAEKPWLTKRVKKSPKDFSSTSSSDEKRIGKSETTKDTIMEEVKEESNDKELVIPIGEKVTKIPKKEDPSAIPRKTGTSKPSSSMLMSIPKSVSSKSPPPPFSNLISNLPKPPASRHVTSAPVEPTPHQHTSTIDNHKWDRSEQQQQNPMTSGPPTSQPPDSSWAGSKRHPYHTNRGPDTEQLYPDDRDPSSGQSYRSDRVSDGAQPYRGHRGVDSGKPFHDDRGPDTVRDWRHQQHPQQPYSDTSYQDVTNQQTQPFSKDQAQAREPTQREVSTINNLEKLIKTVMKPIVSDGMERTRVEQSNFIDLSGSFLNDADDSFDWFDKDENGKTVMQPRIPIFPEDFPPGKPEWNLHWWGIMKPPPELVGNGVARSLKTNQEHRRSSSQRDRS